MLQNNVYSILFFVLPLTIPKNEKDMKLHLTPAKLIASLPVLAYIVYGILTAIGNV